MCFTQRTVKLKDVGDVFSICFPSDVEETIVVNLNMCLIRRFVETVVTTHFHRIYFGIHSS